MKICRKCRVEKSLSDFYKHRGMADGYLNICKDCTRKRVSSYWYRNAGQLRKKERERWQRRKKNPHEIKRRLKYQQRLRSGHPERNRAYCRVHRSLKPPDQCEICGDPCRPHGHHEDYTKPLQVIWVCPVCHRRVKDYA